MELRLIDPSQLCELPILPLVLSVLLVVICMSSPHTCNISSSKSRLCSIMFKEFTELLLVNIEFPSKALLQCVDSE